MGGEKPGPCRCISLFGLVADGNGQRQMERETEEDTTGGGQAVREKQE
jgi:hypothetical protein